MGYSKRAGGILLAVAGMTLVEFGFSDTCSTEILAKASPILGALPGLVLSWIGSMTAKGPITLGGFRK